MYDQPILNYLGILHLSIRPYIPNLLSYLFYSNTEVTDLGENCLFSELLF